MHATLRVVSRFTLLCLFVFGLHAEARQFGTTGRNGQNGPTGYAGADGRSITLTADGTSGSYNLSGSDGRDGGRGGYGDNAYSCFFPTQDPPYNMRGANGGDGGCGGNGGRGGHAGNLTVYFEDIANLTQLRVNAVPGRGGYGGQGAANGSGCRCPKHSWVVKTGETERRYTCQDGRPGMYGRHGSRGANGSWGQVKLISQLTPLSPSITNLKIKMDDMLNHTYVLSRNIWETRSGAGQLFASGSLLNDRYHIFLERVERPYQFKWNVSRPVEDFKGKYIYLNLDSQNNVKMTHSKGIWHDGDLLDDGNGGHIYAFKTAMTLNEVFNFKFKGYSGVGEDFKAIYEDNSGFPQDVLNKVHVDFLVRQNGRYYRRFRGDLAADLVEVHNNQILVHLGKLAIDPKYFTAGNYILARMKMTRTVGHHSAYKQFNYRHQIKEPVPPSN